MDAIPQNEEWEAARVCRMATARGLGATPKCANCPYRLYVSESGMRGTHTCFDCEIEFPAVVLGRMRSTQGGRVGGGDVLDCGY